MTIITHGRKSVFLTTRPMLLDDSKDIADSWASKHIAPNPALKWIIGKYCEADNANQNGQYWSLEDLRLKQPTIHHAPMNVNHVPHKIVGTYVASEMMYPKADDADDGGAHPYIETVSAFWKAYFPETLEEVEKAYNEGTLFQSMECVAETVTCMEGCGQTFEYAGSRSESYCSHINQGGVKALNKPHFMAGALIIPPTRPGWRGASVQEISELIGSQADEAERIMAHLEKQAPDLAVTQWESAMVELLKQSQLSSPLPSPKTVGRVVSRQAF